MVSDSGGEGREHVIDGEENEQENGDKGMKQMIGGDEREQVLVSDGGDEEKE